MACVKGYAQREYKLLQAHLSKQLQRPVEVHWFESLVKAVDEIKHTPDLVIGKDSVVQSDLAELGLAMTAVAALTDKSGETTQTGLLVVRAADPAKTVKDLDGYQILFGNKDAAEKSSAVVAYLKQSEVTPQGKHKRYDACSEAAVALMELPADTKAAAVISSYAQPLLEGCGNIKAGDLRVVGETKPVPFITAFVATDLEDDLKTALTESLLSVGLDAELLTGLETASGFVAYQTKAKANKPGKKKRKMDSDATVKKKPVLN